MIQQVAGRIGICGGTFDPIHFGHLNLAFEMLEKCQLKEIWFCPAQVAPHKQHQDSIPAHHRLKMVELAIHGIPQFKVIDHELRRPAPSYTVDTLRAPMQEAQKSGSGHRFALILGSDSLSGFMNWKEPQAIVELVPLLIGSRAPHLDIPRLSDPLIDQAIQKGVVPTSLLDISSTALRQRLAARRYCNHLVPAAVVSYVVDNQIYR
jgi:nicotinate-nucleotide adenylyltransferase